MKYTTPNQLQQVHLGVPPDGLAPVASYPGDKSLYNEEDRALQATIQRLCPAHLWYKGSHKASCPRPILVTAQHQEQLSRLQNALAVAITNIVERWWTDSDAKFPDRMPLEKQEEDLLKWVEKEALPYRYCLGSWRPDFMVEQGAKSAAVENFRITEINARFSFNGFLHQAYGQLALYNLGMRRNGIMPATDSIKILSGLLSLFRPDVPLHLLKGSEPGIDIHMFIDFAHRRLGSRPRLITPGDLRLVPNPQEKSGYKLCCLTKETPNGAPSSTATLITDDGEIVEEIQQVGLELHQHELFSLQPEIIRQISIRCFNDMRTILLVHDKRMLGIIKQEIPAMVARGVLTPAQGEYLRDGIVDTVLPGSTGLTELIQLCIDDEELRKQYLLKPIRGGKGAGIVFGDEMSSTEWTDALKHMRNPRLEHGTPSFVVQHRVQPALYDVILQRSGERGQYPLIGTYHAIHGQLLGLGIWRSSPDRICAVSHGGSWMCSVIRQ